MQDPLKRRSDLLVVGFLLLLATAPFADVLFGFRSLYIRDLTRYYYPTKRVIREVIQSGEFPYWNRYYSGGQPVASNPEYEVFYPPQWLILLPNYDLGYRLHILLHVWIAIVGMYAFLRSLELGQRAAAFGAISFALGGLVVSMINLLPILFCMVWMPWIFLFTRRYLKSGQLRDFAFTVIFLGIQMLSAEPTTLVQTWFLMGLYALYLAWWEKGRIAAAARNLGKVLAVGVAGALVGAVQLIPAIEHAHESARSRPFDWALVSAWSLHPVRPLELIFPTIFGYVDRHGSLYWASGFYKGTASPFVFNIYFGILGIALVAAALVVRPRGGRFIAALCAFSYLIAIGGHTPLLRFLYDHRVAASIRYFEKFSLMGIFALIVLAALMAQRCLDGDERALRAVTWFLGVVLLFSSVLSLFGMTSYYGPLFRKLWGLGDTMVGRRMTAMSAVDWGWMTIRTLVALGVVELVRRRRFNRFAAICAAMLIAADLSWVTYWTLPRQPRNFFTPPPAIKTLDSARDQYRIFHEADWYNSSDVARSYFSTGDAIYWIVRNGLFPMTPATWGYSTVLERDYDKTALIPTIDLVDSMWKVSKTDKNWRTIFMSMSNARYRGDWVPLEKARKQCAGDFKKADPVQFLDSGPTPRYFFAQRLLRYSSPADFERQLLAGAWTPRTVFIPLAPFAVQEGSVNKVVETANSATLDVSSSGPGFLYMSVTPHKYWRAWIDGHEAPLIVANIGYQGLKMPPGNHRVTMRYRNVLVARMAGLSLTSLLFFLGLSLRRRPLRPARETEELTELTPIEPVSISEPASPEEREGAAIAAAYDPES